MSRQASKRQRRIGPRKQPRIPTVGELRCPSGKFTYGTAGDAFAAVAHLRSRGRDVQAYQCPDCNAWHVTHVRRRRRSSWRA